MSKVQSLFNSRVLRNVLRGESERGLSLPAAAITAVNHWIGQLERGVLNKLTESSAEQTFNSEILGTVLGYEQIGRTVEASLMPKRSSGRHTPDFVLGRFDLTAGVEEWGAVGEIKDAKTDLDQPQVGRANRETPVEQGFRYATQKPGIEWVLVTNLREVRLYKNGYTGAYHSWALNDLRDRERLFEFYVLLRPEGLLGRGREPVASRAFRESISAGRELTEGFYGLYKAVQNELIACLSAQPASAGMTSSQLYGKTHKLLNRVLFVAFCEDHPAELVPRNTLRQVVQRARADGREGAYWREYRDLFSALNIGGGVDGVALNAFNGGLFAHDAYFDAVQIPNALFEKRFRVGRGRRQSLEIVGVFGFDVYDFAEDLDEQALGAIFEQSLKDISNGPARVRGIGEIEVTSQQVGGVYYTPQEVTSYLVERALRRVFERLLEEAETAATGHPKIGAGRGAARRRQMVLLTNYADRLGSLKVMDPACGSGAFLVEALAQLHDEHEKTNRALAELQGSRRQRSLLDLDRLILRQNLYGRDLLPESVEISRLSIWLRTARRGEKLETLDSSITVGDSLRSGDDEAYDVVIGNPPWGAELDGWSAREIDERFPFSGEERDSYALFVIRTWEMLRPEGMLAFVLPNSWLTVDGYGSFRAWLLRHFELLEITNTWKIFRDVNHDAMLLVAKKRREPLASVDAVGLSTMQIAALSRGRSETAKLKQLAERDWFIAHDTTQGFQAKQPNHRFEVIYPSRIADELDQIAGRCMRLDAVADVTVGIQVYHHTKVPREFIQNRGFHSPTREGSDWYPYVDANDVQRYFIEPSTTQWLQYSDLLRDKRELDHYARPRILVQQIFWQGMSACLQTPTDPVLYLNTLFAIYNARGVPLRTLLGLLNSRFVSATYERFTNRLFGDKFPKVSKLDLASIPVPRMSRASSAAIGDAAVALQGEWEALRQALREANADFAAATPEAKLTRVEKFWAISETEFSRKATELFGPLTPTQIAFVRSAYRKAKSAVDTRWHRIVEVESALEGAVRKAYRVSDRVYDAVLDRVPTPTVAWALRP
ncbi:Eco57I restriction-modification methylase domain-containing protein [Sinorhizobium mexicanum]|uniref:site-specific DNA-methyltransferase (adenine-specific) n=1 Tax=Sinorhizobium mexicanum TaxID=375549 RepID=A0A859QKT4_9HYPH|nr:N-6 DNA methylase [Sinorhizobium mexicanum]MBP1886534.1 putative membrane protein [Sinorhizobium mexicanum]QLL63895.1 N-6 DNA methylase [Sinorhizobium mexicanum]